MSTIHPADNPALFGCAQQNIKQERMQTQTVLIGQLRISCCGREMEPKNAFWGAVRVYPARPPISAVSKVGDLADSAEGRASTLTACGEVSIPGDELHTWSLCSPPPPAPAAPGPFVHPSFLAPSPFFLLFFLSSPSLLFSSFPSYTHLSLLLLLLSSPPSCPLFIVDLHAASGLCLRLPLFFSQISPFVSLFAGHYRYPSPL